MIYIILAILSSSLVSIIMRVSEKHVKANASMLAFNYVMCSVLSAYYTGFGNLMPQAEGIGQVIGLSVFNGFLYLFGFLLLQLNVKKNGVVLSATFMKLGLLVPMVLSIGLFREVPSALQAIGFVLAVVAIILINFEKEQTSMQFKAGLVLLLIVGGSADGMSKVFEETCNPALSEQFLLYTFVAALVFCTLLVCVRKERPGKWELFFGLLIGIPNYFSARFLLKALEHVAAVITYPTCSVASIVVVSCAGILLFKERLGKKQWIAIGIILISLVLLNI